MIRSVFSGGQGIIYGISKADGGLYWYNQPDWQTGGDVQGPSKMVGSGWGETFLEQRVSQNPVVVPGGDPNKRGFTGCGLACRVLFPSYYDPLILAFKALKAAGLSEHDARLLAQDGAALAGELVNNGYGPLAGIAAALVTEGCALCAVDSAY